MVSDPDHRTAFLNAWALGYHCAMKKASGRQLPAMACPCCGQQAESLSEATVIGASQSSHMRRCACGHLLRSPLEQQSGWCLECRMLEALRSGESQTQEG